MTTLTTTEIRKRIDKMNRKQLETVIFFMAGYAENAIEAALNRAEENI